MHKLKNKHTGEVITTPYMAEVEEYLNSGNYEMSEKPVYTKEMHERGELPPVGSFVSFRGIGVEVLINKLDAGNCIVVNCGNEYLPVAINVIKPIPTIEDELREIIGNTVKVSDIVKKLQDKYNITPKDSYFSNNQKVMYTKG